MGITELLERLTAEGASGVFSPNDESRKMGSCFFLLVVVVCAFLQFTVQWISTGELGRLMMFVAYPVAAVQTLASALCWAGLHTKDASPARVVTMTVFLALGLVYSWGVATSISAL